ncbi:MAG: hypothetical protein KC609_10115 [Myxococcales bacterium]|nr:hypothetical protein [Myxococcales bacterium]
MIARWRIEARFGQKQAALSLMKEWMKEVGSAVGFGDKALRMVTGSIGALESTIETEFQVDSLAELEAAWAKMATMPGHAAWSKKLEPHIVSGTAHWQIFRVL